MKELLYRLPSSRSFTRLFSILAVAVVAFAALELLFVQPALAGIACCKSGTTEGLKNCFCDSLLACPSTFPFNTGKYCGVSGRYGSLGTINSTIQCAAHSNAFTTLDSTSLFSRSAILDCEVTGSDNMSHNGRAFCKLALSYSRPAGLTQCGSDPQGNPPTYTVSYEAFCGQVGSGNAKNRLTVTGTLDCNHPDVQVLNSSLPPEDLDPNNIPNVCGGNAEPCTLNLGIAGQGGECSELFPALANDPVLNVPVNLAEGQVLKFSTTAELVQGGPNCTNPLPITTPVIGNGPEGLRYCNGNSFNGTPVDCTFGTGKTAQDATVVSATEVAINFDVDFDPTTLNLTCNAENDWTFTILGNQHLDVTLIDVGSLRVEGALPPPNEPITCTEVFTNQPNDIYKDLVCTVKPCPAVAAAVEDARDPVTLEVDITVTGSLMNSGPLIRGEQHVTTNGGSGS
jgi:hypothetical protein